MFLSEVPFENVLNLEVLSVDGFVKGRVTGTFFLDRYPLLDKAARIVEIDWENGNKSTQRHYLLDRVTVVLSSVSEDQNINVRLKNGNPWTEDDQTIVYKSIPAAISAIDDFLKEVTKAGLDYKTDDVEIIVDGRVISNYRKT